MERSLAKLLSYLFHPLVITTAGMMILFHSGTSLSVLQPEVKRLTLIITALFTFVFPAAMIIMLYVTKVIDNIDLSERRERILPISLTIILYLFTFFIMREIPQLTRGHMVFLFCPPAALFVLLLFNNFMKPSIHMAAMGVLLGIILIVIIFYGALIQWMFILAVIVTGLVGSARLILKIHSPREIVTGFMTGFLVTLLIMTIYII